MKYQMPRMSRRVAGRTALTAGVAVAALVAGSAGAAAESRPSWKKPTVVLVHGAFADSSSWNGVVKELLRDGYPVVAAANPLRGLHSDAQYVRSVLASVKGPIVLAGHSYGGSVMSEAAATTSATLEYGVLPPANINSGTLATCDTAVRSFAVS